MTPNKTTRLNPLKPLAVSLSLLTAAAAHAAGSGSLQSLQTRLAQPGADASATLDRFFDNDPGASGQPVFRALTLPSGKPMTQPELRQTMLQELDVIQSAFAAQYGPGQWKQSHSGWDLDARIAQAKRQVQDTPNISMDQYHEILRAFFHSMKDYHVSVAFQSTESSSLPFSVASAGGRYFIAHIDREKLPESAFPFHEGDELVGFGGRKTADVVRELQARLGNNTALTDRALAAMMLTSRKAASFGDVAKGPVEISVKPIGSDKAVSRQLLWDYTPEEIRQPGGARFNALDFAATAKPLLPQMGEMLSPMKEELGLAADNPFTLGSRESFLPPFGKQVWKSDEDAIFHAYIYKTPEGRTIGYVRIPSYEVENPDAALKEFGELTARFQQGADALVIDQVDNPGGSVLYLYALASMLTDRPLKTPPHHVAITQDDVAQALELIKLEPLVKTDAMAKKLLGASQGGYPVDYGFFRHMVEYSRFIVDQWNKGKTLTDPIFIEGVDEINPSQVARYTKPILLLINELDFSGGDFFPAIMQDNKRATLFGTRTAGAGGFIREVKIPNQVGIDHFVVTGSIAVRADKEPIENLGVRADVQYAPTPADMQGGFKDYAKAANAAVLRLIGGGPALTGK
jgi:hypothetical protein